MNRLEELIKITNQLEEECPKLAEKVEKTKNHALKMKDNLKFVEDKFDELEKYKRAIEDNEVYINIFSFADICETRPEYANDNRNSKEETEFCKKMAARLSTARKDLYNDDDVYKTVQRHKNRLKELMLQCERKLVEANADYDIANAEYYLHLNKIRANEIEMFVYEVEATVL